MSYSSSSFPSPRSLEADLTSSNVNIHYNSHSSNSIYNNNQISTSPNTRTQGRNLQHTAMSPDLTVPRSHQNDNEPQRSPTNQWFFQRFMRRQSSTGDYDFLNNSGMPRSSSTSAIESLSREDLDLAILNNNGIPIIANSNSSTSSSSSSSHSRNHRLAPTLTPAPALPHSSRPTQRQTSVPNIPIPPLAKSKKPRAFSSSIPTANLQRSPSGLSTSIGSASGPAPTPNISQPPNLSSSNSNANATISSGVGLGLNIGSASVGSTPNVSIIPSTSSTEKGLVLDSCRCCGTVLKYPANVSKIRCMICQTTLKVSTSNLHQAHNHQHHHMANNKTINSNGNGGNTPPSSPTVPVPVPLLSYSTLKKVIESCNSALHVTENKDTVHEIFKPLEELLFKSFSSHEILNKSFIFDSSKQPNHHSPNINYKELLKFYYLVLQLPTKRPFYKLILGGLNALKHPPIMQNCEDIIWLLILFEIPTFKECLVTSNSIPTTISSSSNNPNKFLTSDLKIITYDLLKRVVGLISYSDKKIVGYLAHWWSRLPQDELVKKIELINLYITFLLTRCINYELYNSVIKPGSNLNMYNSEDDINYKESLSMHFVRPTADSKHFALNIGVPLYIASNTARNVQNANQNSNTNSANNEVMLNNGNNNHGSKKNDHMIKIKLSQYGDDWRLRVAGRLASILFLANQSTKQKKLPATIFYNNLVDYVNVKQDFDAWQFNYGQKKDHEKAVPVESGGGDINNIDSLQLVMEYLQAENKASYLGLSSNNGTLMKKATFTFCQFPFLLSLAAKISILEHEAKRMMERKAEEAFILSLSKKVPIDIQFKIRVRRDHITSDSLRAIKFHQNDFKKSLRIEFVDEPGIDAGGLKKEWFLLLTKELFHPDKGMFSYDERSNLCWFSISPGESTELYYLVGVVVGLAIYNSTILDLKFPLVLYKKLMGQKGTLDDFAQLNPDVASNLKHLLKVKSQEEIDSLELYFEIAYKTVFDEVRERELIPGGASIKVNLENKYDYVDRYVSFYLDEIIEESFNSFAKGFHNVIGGNALSLFTPEEIELLVAGDDNNDQKLDVEILKSITKYVGFSQAEIQSTTIVSNNEETANSNLISWFWDFFDGLSIKKQRKLLSFITGSDRIPATGLTSLNLKITKLKADNNTRLPISHTCFNELCLFDYPSREMFYQKLEQAILCSEGFGLK